MTPGSHAAVQYAIEARRGAVRMKEAPTEAQTEIATKATEESTSETRPMIGEQDMESGIAETTEKEVRCF